MFLFHNGTRIAAKRKTKGQDGRQEEDDDEIPHSSKEPVNAPPGLQHAEAQADEHVLEVEAMLEDLPQPNAPAPFVAPTAAEARSRRVTLTPLSGALRLVLLFLALLLLLLVDNTGNNQSRASNSAASDDGDGSFIFRDQTDWESDGRTVCRCSTTRGHSLRLFYIDD